ncbi:hypothetical protein J2T07_000590 [Luteibacter jiangsuensis]|uniref:Restriction endonuclease n=1 Tax=Luteibacter jiangsuensis TaxID=637577 RepID=A0ABT9STV5_9GAMM|nr:hypothetical protein [Luteibacter jiangsuensis]MDQ0008431.1 hypothetical protein [Luteibacter jiangsuensis]
MTKAGAASGRQQALAERLEMVDVDALGKKGESRFRELCADVGLTFNASLDWDKAGWDFTLDFGMPDAKGISLDHRGSPITCRVQQKTVLESTPSVTLSLKMAERLAKDLTPSFISVFKVSDDLQFAEAYLIHIAGGRLASILKRLRELGKGATDADLRDKTISFVPKQEERLSLTGAALIERLRLHIGPDIHRYTREKQRQLKTMGYESDALTGTFHVSGEHWHDLSDMYLGLHREVEVRNINIIERRFGIPLTTVVMDVATLSFDPRPGRPCSIAFADHSAQERIVFSGTAFTTPPGLPMRSRIQFQWFSVIGNWEGSRTLQFTFDIGDTPGTPDEWCDYWRAIRMINEQRGTVQFIVEDGATTPELPMVPRDDKTVLPDAADLLDIFETLKQVSRRGGLPPGARVKFSDVAVAEGELSLMQALLAGTLEGMRSRIDGKPEPPRTEPRTMLFANSVLVGKYVVAYYATAQSVFVPDETGFTAELTAIRLGRFATVNSKEAFERFIEAAYEREGTDDAMAGGHFRVGMAMAEKLRR